jgi:hypothetical protein
MHGAKVTEEIVEKIAESVGAHPRTVARRVAGLPVRGVAGRVIDRALERRGVIVGTVDVALANDDGLVALPARMSCVPWREADGDERCLIAIGGVPLARPHKTLGECADGEIVFVAYEAAREDDAVFNRGRVRAPK